MANPINFIYGLFGTAINTAGWVIDVAVNSPFEALRATKQWTIDTASSTADKCQLVASEIVGEHVANNAFRLLQSQPVQWTIQKASAAYETGLLSTPPQELLELNQQLATFRNPENISLEDVEKLYQTLVLLDKNRLPLVKAPQVLPEHRAAFDYFRVTIRGIIDNKNQVTATRGTIEEIEELLLRPLTQPKCQEQLVVFSSMIQSTIANNYGFVHMAGNHVRANKGKWVAGAAVMGALGTYYVTGSPLLATTASGLGTAAAYPALVGKLLKPSELVKEGKTKFLGNPLLADARSKARELDNALAKNKPAEIAGAVKTLKPLLEELHKERKTVFNPVLSRNEQRNFQILGNHLNQLDENDPASIEKLKNSSKATLEVLDKRYIAQRGLIEASGDKAKEVIDYARNTAVDTIAPVLQRVDEHVEDIQDTVETAVGANLHSLGITEAPIKPRAARRNAAQPATAPQAAPVNPPPAAGEAEEGTVSQFLEWAATHLTSFMGEKFAGKLSDKVLPTAVGIIAVIVKKIIGTLDDSPEGKIVKAKLNQIEAALNAAAESKEWKKLPAMLQTAANALKEFKIYAGNFRIPVPGTGVHVEGGKTADAALAENIDVLNKAVPTPEPELTNVNWKALALDEQSKLVSNATSFLTMKHIYEEVCGLRPNSEKYRELLRDAQIETTVDGKTKKVLDEEKLKTLFFEELNIRKVGVFRKLYAELQYWIYAKGVKLFIKKATTIYFQEVFRSIEYHEHDKFNTVKNMLINNLTRYLTILGGAYKTVANTPSATGLMSEMLMKELEKPEANLGFGTKDLYTDFAKIVLKKTAGSFFGRIASWFIGNPEEIVRSIIDSSTGSIQDAKGYTHALNTVIGDQLEIVWKLLQPSAPGGPGETTSNPIAISEGQKNQLSILVNNLFEILRKSKCSTVDELRNLMDGKLLSENVNQAIDSLFIQDIIKQTTIILATTVESLVQGKQLEKLAYTFASLINNTFEVGEEVSQSDMQKAEEKVSKLSGQILGSAVNAAIKDQLNFSGKQKQDEANAFIDQLHAISTTYFNDTTTPEGKTINGAATNLQRLKEMDIASLDAKNKVNEIFEATTAYNNKKQELVQLVQASSINNDSKEEINKRILELTEKSNLFIKDIAQLKAHSENLEKLQKSIPHLKKIREITEEIGRRFYDNKAYATKEDVKYAEDELPNMASIIKDLEKVGSVPSDIQLFIFQQQRLEKVVIEQRQALAARSLYSELRQPNSLLEQIAAEKNQQLGQFRQALNQENLNRMKQKLVTEVSSDSLRPQLLEKLKAIEEAIMTSQIEQAKVEFMSVLNQAVSEANGKIIPGRNEHNDCWHKIDGIVNRTRLLEPEKVEAAKGAIYQTIDSAQHHLGQLKAWESQNYKQIVFSNFSWSAMKWLKDEASEKVSGFVHGRVGERLDGVLNLLKREETYRYGILHHAVLIPYVQRQKK